MKISELVTFIKAGYKPAEIAAMESPNDIYALLSEGIKKDDIPGCLELLSGETEPKEKEETQDIEQEEKQECEKEESPEERTDYKDLYQKLLKETQLKETRKNMADEMQDDKKRIEEIVKSFM